MPVNLNAHTPNQFTITLQAGGTPSRISLSMDYTDVPRAVNAHLARIPTTPAVEAIGGAYVAGGFLAIPPGGADPTTNFSRAVIVWGAGQQFILSLVLGGRNRPLNMAIQFRAAFAAPNAVAAITAVTTPLIFGLGLAFGSKHLRMMSPDRFVVLDNLIAQLFGVDVRTLTEADYAQFCADCGMVAQELTRRGIPNPMAARPNGVSRGAPANWFPADVEMAIFSVAKDLFRVTGVTSPKRIGSKMSTNKNDSSASEVVSAECSCGDGGKGSEAGHPEGKRPHRQISVISDSNESYFQIKEDTMGKGENIGYVCKGIRKNYERFGGDVVAYSRLRGLLAAAGCRDLGARPTKNAPHLQPGSETEYWRLFDTSSYSCPPLPALPIPPKPHETSRHPTKKTHNGFRFLERFFHIRYLSK